MNCSMQALTQSSTHLKAKGYALWTSVVFFVFGWMLCSSVQASTSRLRPQASPYQLALLIGNNSAGRRAKRLRYAENDALKMRNVLLQLGGYSPQNIWLLRGRSAAIVRRTMKSIQLHIEKIRQRVGNSQQIVLFFYYSGHAQRGYLLLNSDSMPFHEIKQFLRRVKANLRLAILDACESGALIGKRNNNGVSTKGLKRRKRSFRFPQVRFVPTVEGEVIITATGANENAHEDSRLRGGIFTHYLLSGLRGAADRNQDRHITLQEVYLYAYNRSLSYTIFSQKGLQKARFSKKLRGQGSFVLTRLSKQQSWLRLRKGLTGEFFIWTPQRTLLLAELVKSKAQELTIALAPGSYLLQWRHRQGVYNHSIQLKKGQQLWLKQNGKRLAYLHSQTKKGITSSADPLWKEFHGQLVGPGLGLSYQTNWEILKQTSWLQGADLHLLFPLTDVGSRSLLFMLLGGFRYGSQEISEHLAYKLYRMELGGALLWSLLERTRWWLGVGPVVLGKGLWQQVLPRGERAGESVFSLSLSSGLLFHLQFGFASRWYIHFSPFVGANLMNLGGQLVIRPVLSAGLGIGLRF
mgnify:CR=1 FL=1